MDNKLLGVLLVLSTVLILLVPVVYGLSVHNWDLESLMIPEEDFETLEQSLEDPGGLTVEDESFDPMTGEVGIDVSFESDFNYDIVLKRFSGDIYYEGDYVGNIELEEEEVVLEAGETTGLMLYGEVEQEVLMDAIDLDIIDDMDFEAASPEDFDVENIIIEIEILGAEMKIEDFDAMGVAP